MEDQVQNVKFYEDMALVRDPVGTQMVCFSGKSTLELRMLENNE